MKKLICLSLILTAALLAACTHNSGVINDTDPAARAEQKARLRAAVVRVDTAYGKILRSAGPVAVTGVCLVNPAYCEIARSALSVASRVHAEVNPALVKWAENDNLILPVNITTGAKIFRQNIDEINTMLIDTGGKPIDTAELDAALAGLRVAGAAQ